MTYLFLQLQKLLVLAVRDGLHELHHRLPRALVFESLVSVCAQEILQDILNTELALDIVLLLLWIRFSIEEVDLLFL